MKSLLRFLVVLPTLLASGGLAAAEPMTEDSPADHLPAHITRVTRFGERADWSHDGGSGATERLTHFSDIPGYKASNPVVNDDGRFIAFQMAKSREAAGVGRGIFVLDLGKAPTAKR